MEECSDSDWVLSGNTVPVCHETCFSTLPFNRINNIFKCYEYYITTRNLNRHVLDVFVFVTMTLVLLFSLVCIEKPDVRLTDFVSTTTIVSLSHQSFSTNLQPSITQVTTYSIKTFRSLIVLSLQVIRLNSRFFPFYNLRLHF